MLTMHGVFAQQQSPPGSQQQKQPKTTHTSGTQRHGRIISDTPAEMGATSKSELALPFLPSWRYLTDAPIEFPIALDADRIYVPLARGRLVCLDRKSGSLLWGSDLGGQITAPPVLFDKRLYVATSHTESDGGSVAGTLRQIDNSTGLTVWQKEYPRALTSPLACAADQIYAGCADGAFYAFKALDGSVVWKDQTTDAIRGDALVTPGMIFFGGDDGALHVVDPASGKELWKIQTGGKVVSKPVVLDGHLYFGSGDAHVYCVSLDTGKVKWKARTGAAIVAPPVISDGKLLVGSYDNFFYAFACSSGDKIWKRRFDDRITAPAIVQGDLVLITPYRGDHVAMFLLADGRRVNYYQLDPDCQNVANPVYSDGSLYLPTDRGLLVAAISTPSPSGAATP